MLPERVEHGPVTASPAVVFADVYRAYFDLVWRSARRLGVPEHAVDDAVQECFLVVHRKLGEFEGRSSLKTWIFGIVRRVVRDHRPSQRLEAMAPATLDRLAEPAGSGPLESATNAEAGRRLGRLLEKLDEDKREAFVLVDLEEMTVPEAAEATGANLNTMYARLRAARRILAEALAREQARERSLEECTG
jgi:RNA polymerase sigma-70 factor (ECF subfamily)